MLKTKTFGLILVCFLAFGSVANAISSSELDAYGKALDQQGSAIDQTGVKLDAYGNAIDNDPLNSGASVNGIIKTVGGTNTSVKSTSGGSVNVKSSNGTSVNVQGTTNSVNVGSTGSGVNVSVGGKSVQVNSSQGSLNVQVGNAELNISDKENIVSLKGNVDLIIKSDSDLEAYNSLIIETRPSVSKISVNGNSIDVSYNQPARFLGVYSTTISGRVVVGNDKTVSIKLPWYSFLFSKNTASIESEVKSDLNVAETKNIVNLGLVGKNGNSGSVGVTNTNGQASLNVRNNAHTLNIITNTINNSASISGK